MSIAKNGVFQTILSTSLSKVAHVPVRIGSTSVSFLKTAITLKNIRFYNPRSFPEKLMIDAPLVAINFDPGALWKGQLHFEEANLNLKEIVVIKNRAGQLNIDALKPSESEKKKAKEPSKGEAPQLKIDKLFLSIGRVIYKDYSQGGSPKTEVFDVNIQNRIYTNIDDPGVIVSLIMFEALTRTTLSKLTNLDLSLFKDQAGGAPSGGLGIMGQGADKAEAAAQKILSLFK